MGHCWFGSGQKVEPGTLLPAVLCQSRRSTIRSISRDVADFTWDDTTALTGNGSSVSETTVVAGTDPLAGTFQLGFREEASGGVNVTDELEHDSSAAAMSLAVA